MAELKIAPVATNAATYAVEHWHYSKSLPVPPRTMFGVWEDNKFIGVVIYSRGASSTLGGPFGLSQVEVCELTRVALAEHKHPVSQIVAETLRELRKHSPGLRLVVSYADPFEGHHGGIYQAGNWIYTGETKPYVAFLDDSGKRWHTRQVSPTGRRKQFGRWRRVPKSTDLEKIQIPGKHRYVMPLDRSMRRHVTKLAQEYPSKY